MFKDDSCDDSEVDLKDDDFDDSIDADLFFENVGEIVFDYINRVAVGGWFSHVEKKVSDDKEQDYAFDELLSEEVE